MSKLVVNRVRSGAVYVVVLAFVWTGCPPAPQPVEAPDVAGLSQPEAQSLLVASGLVVGDLSEGFDDSVPPGHVISQMPEAGTPMEQGDPVALEIRGPAQIAVIDSPAYGETGPVTGIVTGPAPDNYEIHAYIEVEEEVFWTKPTYADPVTGVDPDGSWALYFTTHENDVYASRVVLLLVPQGAAPTECSPCLSEPANLEAIDSVTIDRAPPLRILQFAGYEWAVKRRDFPAGPGGNYFSDDPAAVWVDDRGLHLTIGQSNGVWYCTEAIGQTSFGYGAYRFVTQGRVDLLDPRAVGGMFTWDTRAPCQAYRELDIEFARWSNPAEPTNAQYVVQPCAECPGCGLCQRFTIELSQDTDYLTSYIVWEPGRVEFRSYYGRFSAEETPPIWALAANWVFSGSEVPSPGEETVRLNLWLHNGNPPSGDIGQELVISDFSWQEDAPSWDNPGEPMEIVFTHVPPYGSHENLSGKLVGYMPSAYRIAAYIHVGSGWWTKPTFDAPTVPVMANGDFTIDITTGGVDETATRIATFAIPAGVTPPIASGGPLPEIPDAVAFAEAVRSPE